MPRLTKKITVGGREITVGEATLGGLAHFEGLDAETMELPDWEARTRELFELCVLDCSWEELRALVKEGKPYASELDALWAALEEVNAPFARSSANFGGLAAGAGELFPLLLQTSFAASRQPATPAAGTTEGA